MKVAICFIGTSRYVEFLPQYYENIEKYFLPGVEKTILAFTDGQLEGLPDNIIPYYQEHLDWPYITLTRFEIIKRASDIISEHDWFVFIDADALVVDKITEEEFFNPDKPFFGVHHPCHYLKMPPHDRMPAAFETNPKSTACIKDTDDTSVYYQGCLWGGRVPDVLEMIEELNHRVNKDLKDGVIAVWHDESQLNKFYCQQKEHVHTLGPEFAYPEVFSNSCDFEPKIVHLAKENSKYHV